MVNCLIAELGNTITNLFGGGEKDKESESKVEDPETPTEVKILFLAC